MEVPNLPVFRSNRQRAAPRPQNFTITRDGVPTEQHAPTSSFAAADAAAAAAGSAPDRFRTTAQLAQTGTRDTGLLASSALRTTRAAAAGAPVVKPSYVELDRQVLRFYSYFKEAVHESAAEDARVRKCTIQFFLVDGTSMIIEHREENSGIPQGTFVKRHRIPKPSGEAYDWTDLVVGGEITVYGRTLRIVDCDDFTRGFYGSRGFDQAPAERYPDDPYNSLRQTMAVGKGEGGFGCKSNPLKKFMEASLGKVAAGRGEDENLRQFLDNDRKVLRFHCTWDDTGRLYGDKIAYTLHYFLADDTVEVREVPVMNSGRDNFPMLLRKQKLPKNWKSDLHNDAARGVEDNPPPGTYVRPEELRVGGSVNVFGRDLKICACDAFTSKWYRDNLGFEQGAPIGGDDSKADEESKAVPIPPYTGFGEEADSLASFYSLVPKPPKKDFNKFMKNDRKVLRFSARLARACPEDRHRSFIIQLYLADDTLAIYEPAIRNSGIVGGQFLVRNKYRKDNGETYGVADFVPGQEITIYKRRFLVVDADDFTKHMYPALLPAGAEATPARSDPRCAAALAKVRETLRRQGIHGIHGMARVFRRMNENGDEGLNMDEVAAGFAEVGCKLSEAEIADVFNAFDTNSNGKISFEEFLAANRGAMNHRRLALCHAAFDLLDEDSTGSVSLDDVVAKYDFSQNERVLSGAQSVLEAAEEFVAQWDTLKVDGVIDREEFIDYCKGVSASIDSDDYFQLVMKKAWRI